MEGSYLVRKIHMECPLCDKVHEVEKRSRIANILIKGENVEYEENYYFCSNSLEEENEFTPGKMENENLLNARNSYRKKHNLLTSNEIVEIREQYGLSQADFAKLLGWGEATISRYESKAIQDEAYDNMLRLIKSNPLKVNEFLEKNGERFSLSKRLSIKDKIIANLDVYGKEYLQRQDLEGDYVEFQELSDANGNQTLNIDKVESVISYFASNVNHLYKGKLMRLLWYADCLNYKMQGRAITGLVYRHEGAGAMPVGHYRLVGLQNVKAVEEEELDYTKYYFLPNENMTVECLTSEEIKVLDLVISKFKNCDVQEITKYMDEEEGYNSTQTGDIISFDFAKEIRAF